MLCDFENDILKILLYIDNISCNRCYYNYFSFGSIYHCKLRNTDKVKYFCYNFLDPNMLELNICSSNTLKIGIII